MDFYEDWKKKYICKEMIQLNPFHFKDNRFEYIFDDRLCKEICSNKCEEFFYNKIITSKIKMKENLFENKIIIDFDFENSNYIIDIIYLEDYIYSKFDLDNTLFKNKNEIFNLNKVDEKIKIYNEIVLEKTVIYFKNKPEYKIKSLYNDYDIEIRK